MQKLVKPMRASITKKITQNNFLLSIILHLLFLLILLMMSTIISYNPREKTKKSPQLYIPSYVYKGAITPPPQVTKIQNQPQTQTVTKTQSSAQPVTQKIENKAGTLPPREKNTAVSKQNPFQQKSVLDLSRSFIQHNQVDAAINRLNDTEPPILLVGDKHAIVDPLVKLVARSLSAHFRYPRIEGTFGARGIVYIELVIHPEGYFSDVQIVKPSDIQDFNTAALYAVNTAPTAVGVDKFLPRPKRFVVGFIFE